MDMYQAHSYKFSFLSSQNLSNSVWFQRTQQFLKKKEFNFENRVIFGEGQRMTFTFDILVCSIDHLVECMHKL